MDVLSMGLACEEPLQRWNFSTPLRPSPKMSELDRKNLPDIEDMVSACAGLVAIRVDKVSGVVRLAHYTAQEHLEQALNSRSPEQKFRSCEPARYLSLL